jgi:hypothetical protein
VRARKATQRWVLERKGWLLSTKLCLKAES